MISFTALYVMTFLNGVMPGPCAVLAASRTARYGVPSGLRVSIGVIVGVVVLTGLAFGVLLGALSLSLQILIAMKWIGVVALAVLAARSLRSALWAAGAAREVRASAGGDFGAGVIVVMSSPSALVFLLALLPQFIPSGVPDLEPAIIASAVFVAGMAAAQVVALALGAGSAQLGGWRAIRLIDGAGAALLMIFALAAVFAPVGSTRFPETGDPIPVLAVR